MSSGQPIAARAGGAAQRRRDRRLHSCLRREWMSVRVAVPPVQPGGAPDELVEPGAQGQERPWTLPRRLQLAPEPQPLVHVGVGEVHDGPLVSFSLPVRVAGAKEGGGEGGEAVEEESGGRLS